MQIGIDGFVATIPDALRGTNVDPADRLSNLLEEIMLADEVGLDTFGIGEHHRAEFLDSSPETILAAQMGAAALRHAKHMHAIELLGTKVAPLVRHRMHAASSGR